MAASTSRSNRTSGSLTSRAKIITTGFSPFSHTKQCGRPAYSPVTFNGSNAPGSMSPGCSPDRTGSAATSEPTDQTNSSATAAFRRNKRCMG